MTSGGKVRIYELSRDLGLDNRDVLNAAEKLSIAAKSHSSSISDGEAAKIKALLNSNGKAAGGAKAPAKPDAGNQILSLKKAPSTPSQSAAAPASAPPSRKPETRKQKTRNNIEDKPLFRKTKTNQKTWKSK